jgi:single-strand DNA-binding protein
MLNAVQLIGHLGADPEIRYGASGKAVCTMSVATSESWKDKSTGDKREETEWHRVVCYDRLAEICAEYLKKGALIYLSGRLKTRKWTDQNGVERWTTEIVGNEMKMLGTKPR